MERSLRHWQRWLSIWVCLMVLGMVLPASAVADDTKPDGGDDLLPFRYARALTTKVPVYPAPGNPDQVAPQQFLLPPDSWISIDEEVEQDGELWYRIAEDAYVRADELYSSPPSAFHGLLLEETPQYPIGFVITPQLNVRARPGVDADNPPLRRLFYYDTVDIRSSLEVDGGLWHQIGDEEWINGAYVRVVHPVERPAEVSATEKWIAVDLAQQTLAAFEGDRQVLATLVSSGRPPWFTPKGLYRIRVKYRTGDMRGGIVERGDYYELQDVPWIMYFWRHVGLHGTYWHDRFGWPSSHGCVNLSPQDASWLFDWTGPQFPQPELGEAWAGRHNPGTWVYVYASTD